jgi:Mg2+/citrate symporter
MAVLGLGLLMWAIAGLLKTLVMLIPVGPPIARGAAALAGTLLLIWRVSGMIVPPQIFLESALVTVLAEALLVGYHQWTHRHRPTDLHDELQRLHQLRR